MIELTDEQRSLRATARDFAAREIAPVVARAERRGDGHLDAEEYLAVHRAGTRLGLHAMLLPEEFGGGGLGAFELALVAEELGAADVGLAAGLNLTTAVANLLVAAGTAEQRGRLLPAIVAADDHILAGALNEPDVAGSDLFCPDPDPSLGIRTRAVLDGDRYRINGAKAGWVTNAGVAKAYFVFARTALDEPASTSTTMFYVPAATPGLTVGTRSDLLGMRSAWHAEVLLDDVEVPVVDRIGEEGRGLEVMNMASGAMVVGLAAAFVGLARGAHEATLAYAGERRSWGVSIRQHQAVALQLADGAVDLRSARLLVWDAAMAVDRGDIGALPVALPAAKARAVEVAIANAERAVRIHGAMGVTRGVGPEKCLRDAWTGWSCDFTGDLLRLGIAGAL